MTAVPPDARRSELAAFLRSRRQGLAPEAVGLPPHRRRRTAGLRREEVASIADVSVTWYTWLEQGRRIRASRDALERIAAALHLSSSDTQYFLTLADAERDEAPKEPEEQDTLRLVLNGVDGIPAFALDSRADVLAFNDLADRIYTFDPGGSPFGNNHVWRCFADPSRRLLYGDSWERVATASVGILRANYASLVGDPRFEELLRELRATEPEFNRRWQAQYTTPRSRTIPLTFSHGKLGRLDVHSVRLTLPERPGDTLLVMPPADRRTAAVFERVRSARSAERWR
jgi:transcriptional regulator with XRE-family HTH domain